MLGGRRGRSADGPEVTFWRRTWIFTVAVVAIGFGVALLGGGPQEFVGALLLALAAVLVREAVDG